jgi:non-ribosomal peptide synthetase component E (peptide arylation enzyme)
VATHGRVEQRAVLAALASTAVGKIDKKALACQLGGPA